MIHDSMLCTWKACFQDTMRARKSEDDASDEGHEYLRIAFTLTMLVSKYREHRGGTPPKHSIEFGVRCK